MVGEGREGKFVLPTIKIPYIIINDLLSSSVDGYSLTDLCQNLKKKTVNGSQELIMSM